MTGDTRDNASSKTAGARGRSRGRRRAWTVVFVVALVVFVASLVSLGVIWYSYYQGQQKYGEIAEYADVNESSAIDELSVDWEALAAANPDVVAWVYIPGTAINYPVVRGADNDYYLTHDFDGAAGWLANYGAIFMDYRNVPGWTDEAYFIFGHHMNDGSMFADIAAMRDQQRFDASRTVYLLSPQGNFKLRTFSLVRCGAFDPIVQANFSDAQERTAYVQDKIDRAIVSVDDTPAAAEITKCFAFATCDNFEEGRYVLYAYIEDTTAAGLAGTIGIASEDGQATGFVDEVGEV